MNWQAKEKLLLGSSISIQTKFMIIFATIISSFLQKTKEQEKKSSTILLLIALIMNQN